MSDPSEVFTGLPGYHDEKEGKPFARSYIGWAPGGDYMSGEGWQENMSFESWTDFSGFTEGDMDLNLVADFYFDLTHDSVPCLHCGQSGYNTETARIADDFYDFAGTGRKWCDRITGDEVAALVEHGRLWDFTREFIPGEGWKDKNPAYVPTPEEVNAWQRGPGLGHDAINRHILIEARGKHPRKGASRGATVRSVSPDDLPEVRAYLRRQVEHMQGRFAWALAGDAP